MKIHPKHIGFDIDGVVADTMEAFIRLAHEDYGIENITPSDITEFLAEDCLTIDPYIIEEIFNRLLTSPLEAGLKPMAGSMVVLKKLSQKAPLTFITARPQKDPIAQWLEANLGPEIFGACRLIATGEHDSKGEYIKNMGLKYFVDDRAQTCILLGKQDIIPIVFSQPWNQGKHNLTSVENWQAIHEMCQIPAESSPSD
ncbi:MAG: hypothetical protein KKB30_04105 [Proteobacteria bacterium]|nr:hypothetical protein [Pseudomonadota bacterium]MBU1714917.1 hypothetical protein [Pseudomonadota bacterium]